MALDLGIFIQQIKNLFKVKVTENDTTPDYLLNKLTSSDASVTITELNDGGIEQINLTTSGGGGSSPLTTKGDVYTYDTGDARLPVGSDGEVLVADSAEATGLKWDTVSGSNISNANLTWTGNTTQDLDGNILTFDNGQVTIQGSGSTPITTNFLLENSSGTDLFKMDDSGGFALGNGATYTDNTCVSIGGSAAATGLRTVAVGEGASAPTADGTSIGYNSSTGSDGTAVGANALTVSGVAIGEGSSANNTGGVAAGNNASANAFNGIAIGDNATVTAGRAISIGSGSSSTNNRSVSIGYLSAVTGIYSIQLSAANSAKTNSISNSFAVNLNQTDDTLFVGHSTDSYYSGSGSFGFGTTTPNSIVTVEGDLSILDGMTAPSATVGYAKLYVDSSDGDLKIVFGDGTVKTIVTDS